MNQEPIYSQNALSPTKNGTTALISLALIVLTLAVYLQVGNHAFINLDDNAYIMNNPRIANGITARNIMWAFTSVDVYNWHPITWISHMADVQMFGINPRGHHLTSVAIHILSTLLLFLLLARITGAVWRSSFVAALFALHPLHIQSVAWASERKDVLSALFWFLTIFFYSEYTAKQKSARYYLLALFSFILGLMSKPMLVTLPIVMLLMDFWPLNRFRQEQLQEEPHRITGRFVVLVKEKVPFFICSVLSGLMTIYAQGKGGAIADTPFWFRCENALVAYVTYIDKTIRPRNLAVFYPYPLSIPTWQVIGSLIFLFIVSAAAIRIRRKAPYIAMGWFWFLITLLPVIGIIQVGGQSMADRYTYIPIIGLFIMAAWGVPDIAKGLRHSRPILAILAGAVVISSAATTWQQLGYWKDSIRLFRHTLQVTTGNCMINNNLGLTLALKGDYDEAIREFHNAIRIDPNYLDAHNNLGATLDFKGDFDAAMREYREALRINPNYADAHFNLGIDLQIKGDLDAAIHEYQEALRIKPSYTKAQKRLQSALSQKWRM